MTSVVAWLLVLSAQSYRPAVVVQRFNNESACVSAAAEIEARAKYLNYPFCLPIKN